MQGRQPAYGYQDRDRRQRAEGPFGGLPAKGEEDGDGHRGKPRQQKPIGPPDDAYQRDSQAQQSEHEEEGIHSRAALKVVDGLIVALDGDDLCRVHDFGPDTLCVLLYAELRANRPRLVDALIAEIRVADEIEPHRREDERADDDDDPQVGPCTFRPRAGQGYRHQVGSRHEHR